MRNLIQQLISFILPITVLILVPLYIESDVSIKNIPSLSIGTLIMCAELCVTTAAISTFILTGKGTLAPWSPTRKLIIGGIYGYVRNPMIMGVMTVLIGESIAIISLNIFIWTIMFFVINNFYFILYEEPNLAKRFGDEYREYKRNVPRWIPRTTPFKPDIEL